MFVVSVSSFCFLPRFFRSMNASQNNSMNASQNNSMNASQTKQLHETKTVDKKRSSALNSSIIIPTYSLLRRS